MLKREIEYFLILWLYASVIVKLVNYYYPINFNIELFYVTNYVGYFLLGYYLSNYDIAKNGETYLILGNFRFIGTFFITYYYTVKANGQLDQYWYEYFAPGVVLMAIGLFVFLNTLSKIRKDNYHFITWYKPSKSWNLYSSLFLIK